MAARLDAALYTLLEDVDTAPEGDALEDALDALLDWVQINRSDLMTALAPREAPPAPPPPTLVVRATDEATPVLRAFLALLVAQEGVNYVPAAVTKRGNAFIPTPAPPMMTEAMFRTLLEAEAQTAEDAGDQAAADGLRLDLRRRQQAHEAQDRRAEQIAALAPIKGRLPLVKASTL